MRSHKFGIFETPPVSVKLKWLFIKNLIFYQSLYTHALYYSCLNKAQAISTKAHKFFGGYWMTPLVGLYDTGQFILFGVTKNEKNLLFLKSSFYFEKAPQLTLHDR